MFTTALILATTILATTSASPYVRLAPPTAFSTQGSSTTPASSICGQPGNLPYVISSHPMIALGELAGVPGSPACATHCLAQTACTSFSYNQINGSCSTFTESLMEMSFHRNSGPIFWWDRMCFERHGDWLGEEDDRDLSMVSGRIRPVAPSPKQDVVTEAVDEVIQVAIAIRPTEVQHARTKMAKQLAVVAAATEVELPSVPVVPAKHTTFSNDVEEAPRKSSLFEHGEQVKLDRRFEEKPRTRRGSRWSVPATKKR